MKFYIRLKDAPELQGLSASQRALVHRLCYQRCVGSAWQIWLANLLLGLCGGFGVWAGKLAAQFSDLPFMPTIIAGTCVGAMVGFLVFRQIVISHLRPFYPECIKEMAQKPPGQ